MANLTLAVDDDVLRKARLKAVHEDTSVNAVVREFLREYTDGNSRQAAAGRRLLSFAHAHSFKTKGQKWDRASLYDRDMRSKNS